MHKEPPTHGGPKRTLQDDQRPQPLEHPLDEHDQQHACLNTHRGEPFAFINDRDARRKGIENGEWVKRRQRRRLDADHGEDLAGRAARPGHRLQRLRAVHARGAGTARPTSSPAT